MALLAPQFIDSVVAIGRDDPLAVGTIRWVASGFLYGRYRPDIPAINDKKLYTPYLVTNRHVIENLDKMFLRFNPVGDEPAREFRLELLGEENQYWFCHPDDTVDVAVLPVNYSYLEEQSMQIYCIKGDDQATCIDRMAELGFAEGDFVYALGFPMELVGETRNAVLVRHGCVARIHDIYSRVSKDFLIDCFTYPGNSGGPVFSKPEPLHHIQGTKSQSASFLIGIVSSSISYVDVAYSRQTQRPRITFEDNSGLTAVLPVDYIEEAINVHLASVSAVEKE